MESVGRHGQHECAEPAVIGSAPLFPSVAVMSDPCNLIASLPVEVGERILAKAFPPEVLLLVSPNLFLRCLVSGFGT